MPSKQSGHRLILTLYYIFLAAGVYFIYKHGQDESFLILNSYSSAFLDFFMKYWTYVGGGMITVIIGVLLLFRRLRDGIYLIMTLIVSALVVQLLKHLVFAEHARPYRYFTDLGIDINTVTGVTLHNYYSFPSGHTATAFALFFSLIFISRNMLWDIVFFLCALGVGYSRIYLGQHFPVDVLGGSLIGVLSALALYPAVYNSQREWLDLKLTNVFKKREK